MRSGPEERWFLVECWGCAVWVGAFRPDPESLRGGRAASGRWALTENAWIGYCLVRLCWSRCVRAWQERLDVHGSVPWLIGLDPTRGIRLQRRIRRRRPPSVRLGEGSISDQSPHGRARWVDRADHHDVPRMAGFALSESNQRRLPGHADRQRAWFFRGLCACAVRSRWCVLGSADSYIRITRQPDILTAGRWPGPLERTQSHD